MTMFGKLRKEKVLITGYLTVCNPMNCSLPGLPVHHQLPELAQTHVHCVGDAFQPSHPLLFPSSPACNLSQHQGLFSFFIFYFLYCSGFCHTLK